MGKKIVLLLSLLIMVATGCAISNTPNSKVEELLGKYQCLDSSVVNIQTSDLATGTNLDDDLEKRYKEVIKRQYKNMSYEIKDDKIDGDSAVITTEVKVLDYKSVYSKYANNNEEVEDYDRHVIDDLEKIHDKITYTIDFNLTRDNKGVWKLDGLTTAAQDKLLGIY